MKQADWKKMLEERRWRALSPEEKASLEAHFQAHPEERAAWEEEQRLEALLDLPPVPKASSNFTARVMAEVSAWEKTPPAQSPSWGSSWGWVKNAFAWRLAMGTAVVLLAAGGFSSYRHAQTKAQMEQMALFTGATAGFLENLGVGPKVSIISPVKGASAELTPMELWQDFEAIQKLHYVPATMDEELILALQ